MVEKDTGRSRGFGFVSYDAPASAALAIKELNGFAVSTLHQSYAPERMNNVCFIPCDFLTFVVLVLNFKIGNKRLKVQHKQIRPSDQNHRDPQDFYGATGQGNFPRSAYSHHLPPSGALAAQNMGPSSPWLAQNVPGADDGGGQPGMNQDNNPANGPGDGVTDPSTGVVLGSPDGSALSPLANLDPLRNALPDVSGNE